ncbi:hypothetical protein [Streptomyces sp. NPDC014006]|uniref:hypothetical protein n=1 Tax=Streptomyces sp. NPDC014006 TaxID=3364870 RepID=UPI0036FC3246
MLAGAALLAPAGARLVVDGLYFAGLGLGIMLATPSQYCWPADVARVSKPIDGTSQE